MAFSPAHPFDFDNLHTEFNFYLCFALISHIIKVKIFEIVSFFRKKKTLDKYLIKTETDCSLFFSRIQ